MMGRVLKSQKAAIWYVALVIVLPTLMLVLIGIFTLWQRDWLLNASFIWLTCTLIGYAFYRLWHTMTAPNVNSTSSQHRVKGKSSQTKNPVLTDGNNFQPQNSHDEEQLDNTLPARLEARTDWDTAEMEIWRQALNSIESLLEPVPDWQELPDICLYMISFVSSSYKKSNPSKPLVANVENLLSDRKIYTFTLPEILLVLSITLSRYRQLLLNYIPFVDSINISSLLSWYDKKDQLKAGFKWVNIAKRTVRFANPLAAITAELRDHFTGQLFSNVSEKMQLDLKRILLQELVQVSMDLYSGRLKSSDNELASFTSDTYQQDQRNTAPATEPLRVVLVGQTSSGKSALVNALKEKFVAESDVLPTTKNATVYSLTLIKPNSDDNATKGTISESIASPEDQIALHLVDTKGLTKNHDSLEAITAESLNADLLIWVARANQPARAADSNLQENIHSALITQDRRLPPPAILVLTHIDQLNPKAMWQPPYDLDSNEKKAQNIKQALISCKEQIGLTEELPAIPVCLASQYDPYNVDIVAAQIMVLYNDSLLSQLSRRRLERDNRGTRWHERWDQAKKLGVVSGALLSRSILNRGDT